jgi:hypothetical protein
MKILIPPQEKGFYRDGLYRVEGFLPSRAKVVYTEMMIIRDLEYKHSHFTISVRTQFPWG